MVRAQHDNSERVDERLSLFTYSVPIRSPRLERWAISRATAEQHWSEFGPGTSVYAGSTSGRGIWVLISGDAECQFHNASCSIDRSVPVTKGSILGLTETLAGEPYNCTFRARTTCTYTHICFDELKEALLRDPVLRAEVLRCLAVELGRATGRALKS